VNAPTAQITFLYYADLAPAAAFYGETLGLPLVLDQGWAKIYRVAAGAHLGIVTGAAAFHQPQEHNAVLISLVVADAAAWCARLQAAGVPILRPLAERPEIHLRTCFVQDPGGYAVELQEFTDAGLNPD
jgi:predicted enzyme related to lactoylglutathione lyase